MTLALQPGALVHVRQRRWVVENVRPPVSSGDSPIVDLACGRRHYQHSAQR